MQDFPALEEALSLGRGELAELILRENWTSLVYEQSEEIRRSFLESIPEVGTFEELQRAARVLLRGGSVTSLPPEPSLVDPAILEKWGGLPGIVELLMLATVQISLLRYASKAAESAELAWQLERIAASAERSQPDAVSGLLPALRLRWAKASQLTGNTIASTIVFTRSFTAGQHEDNSPAAGTAAANIALNQALAGEATLACTWLDSWQDQQPEQDRLGDPGRVPALIARALLELERVNTAAAETALDELGEIANGEDLWAFAVYAHCQWALLTGRPWQGLELLERFRVAYTRPWHEPAVSEALLVAAGVDLQCAVGAGNHARSLIEAYTGDHPLVRVARARLALLTGDSDTAWTEATFLTAGTGHGPRVVVDGLLIEAVGLARAGRDAEAVSAWGHAVAIAEKSGTIRPFAALPQSMLDELAAIGATIPAPWSEQARQGSAFPDRVAIVNLTGREHSVASALARNPDWTMSEIAAQSGVSPNTVKTQMRSLYRKLNVNTRQDAVRTAIALKLLTQ